MTQNATILAHLKRGESITAALAIRRYGIYRLAARVYDLQKRGERIQSTLVIKGKNRFSMYWMEGR